MLHYNYQILPVTHQIRDVRFRYEANNFFDYKGFNLLDHIRCLFVMLKIYNNILYFSINGNVKDIQYIVILMIHSLL